MRMSKKFEKLERMTKEEIEEYLKDFKPYFQSAKHKYFVNINGTMFPIVQVVCLICGLAPVEVSSGEAFALLRKKGFEIIVKGENS